MHKAPRWVAGAVLMAAMLGACGGASPAPTTQATSGSSTPAATGPAATSAAGNPFGALTAALLGPVFGATVPTPECGTRGDEGQYCRWTSADGQVVLDAESDPTFDSVDAWRTAFGTAGFDEEIPGIGVGALGGTNPLADGFRASTYTSDGTAYTVTLNKTGDAKTLVLAILGALAA